MKLSQEFLIEFQWEWEDTLDRLFRLGDRATANRQWLRIQSNLNLFRRSGLGIPSSSQATAKRSLHCCSAASSSAILGMASRLLRAKPAPSAPANNNSLMEASTNTLDPPKSKGKAMTASRGAKANVAGPTLAKAVVSNPFFPKSSA